MLFSTNPSLYSAYQGCKILGFLRLQYHELGAQTNLDLELLVSQHNSDTSPLPFAPILIDIYKKEIMSKECSDTLNTMDCRITLFFFQNLFLMMDLKCFYLHLSILPTRDSEKKGYGEVNLSRNVPWSNSCMCCLGIISSIHRLTGNVTFIHFQTVHGYTSYPVQ